MFNKKPKRNFRQRKGESSDEENEQKNQNNMLQIASTVPKQIQIQIPQGRGISCSSKRDTTPPKSDCSDDDEGIKTHINDTVEHGMNVTEQKKKGNAVLSFSDDKDAEGADFKIKKSSNKAVVFQARRKGGKSAKKTHSTVQAARACLLTGPSRHELTSQASPHTSHQEDDDDDNDDDDNDDYQDDEDSQTDSSSSLSSFSPSPASSPSAFTPVVIPDAKAIQAARRRRQEARSQKDFISLDQGDGSSRGSTPDHRSRDGERDEDDEPDDCERRIEFAPRSKSIRERITEKLGSSDDGISDSEKEEQELWEETQIGKGVKRRPGEQSPSGSEASSHNSSSSSRRRNRQRQKKSLNLPESLPAVTISMVKRRLTGKLESLKEVHRARQAELRRMEGDVESASSTLESLEGKASEKQLRFYRAMTLYIHNLVECLQEKVVDVNSLELELHTLMSDQMESLLAQRRGTVGEEAARLQQLSYSTTEQEEDPSGVIQSQGEGHSGKGSVEVCEDIPEDMQPSAEEAEQLQKKRDAILLQAETVFSDVQEDFSDVKKILSRFEEWRGAYSYTYHSAYISLCLPKLLNPVIRHQLLAWNPLMDACVDFEALPWYSAVEMFCHGRGYEELENTDRKTLPNVIEKTVLPKITAYVELVWDPLSLQQTNHLSDVCHKLNDDYSVFSGEQSKPAKVLVEAVVSRLRSCVDEDVFIPLYPKKFLEDRLSPQCRFRDEQLWSAVKLLGNMGKWDMLLPESVLKELMLDKLLTRYLMITLLNQTPASNTVCTCRKIADSLPVSWFKEENICLPQLKSFTEHLVQTAHSICKQHPSEEPDTRSKVLEVLQVLSRIRSFHSVMTIAEKYNYQDLIYTHQLLNPDTV